MKSIKTILVVLVLTSFTQLNAQKILDKWEDLNNVNQIYTKISMLANEGNFAILPKYTVILKEYTEKLNEKSVPGNLGSSAVAEMIKSLKTQASTFNESAEKMKAKDETLSYMKSYGETLNKLISSLKIE
ncbi:hypothetical protein [Flavobacterium sp.]